jgi:hypothetical protein
LRSIERNFGKYLLFNALDRIAVLARKIALFAVVVDAKNNTAAGFYLRYGFQPLSNQGSSSPSASRDLCPENLIFENHPDGRQHHRTHRRRCEIVW